MAGNELKPIVFEDFQKGIASSPHLGISDMRCINILSSPGAALVNFSTTALTLPPVVSALAYSVATTDIFTVASTTNWYNGMAVVLNTVVTAVGISANRVYWVGDLTGTTFKLYKSPSLIAGSRADVTTAGTGTLSTYTLGNIIDKTFHIEVGTAATGNGVYYVDDKGQAWGVGNFGGSVTTNLVFLGNDNAATGNGKAIVAFNGDLVVFSAGQIDTLNIDNIYDGTDLDGVSGWDYAVETITGTIRPLRPVLVGQDNFLYFDNYAGVLGSFTSAYAKNSSALDLPSNEDILSLAELGPNLLIGGINNLIYPWDRVSPSFSYPITVPDRKIVRMVSANNIVYVFAGFRGRIYKTDGSSVVLYKKIPDYLSGAIEPYYTWGDAMSARNQLYFTFTATENDGTALTTTGGVWGIDLLSEALRCVNKLSYGTYGGSAPALAPNVLSDTPAGNGMYVGWANSGTYGVDVSSANLYSNYEAYIESGLISTGSSLIKKDFETIQQQLAKLLTTGQGAKLSYRKNLTDSYTTIITIDFTTQGGVQSHYEKADIGDAEFVQFKLEIKSNASSDTSPELRRIILN